MSSDAAAAVAFVLAAGAAAAAVALLTSWPAALFVVAGGLALAGWDLARR